MLSGWFWFISVFLTGPKPFKLMIVGPPATYNEHRTMKIRAWLKKNTPVTNILITKTAWGHTVYASETTPYIEFDELPTGVEAIHPDLEAYVLVYSLHDSFYGGGEKTTRSTGVYKHESASATVERNTSCLHKIKAEGSVLEDLLAIVRLIREGNIVPAASYEAGQIESNTVRGAIHNLVETLARWFDSSIKFA